MSDEPVSTEPRKRPIFNTPHFWLCLVLTFMVGSIIVGEFFLHVPTENQRVIDTMSGSIVTAWLGALAFFFNTTLGSNMKTELLAKANPVDPHS